MCRDIPQISFSRNTNKSLVFDRVVRVFFVFCFVRARGMWQRCKFGVIHMFVRDGSDGNDVGQLCQKHLPRDATFKTSRISFLCTRPRKLLRSGASCFPQATREKSIPLPRSSEDHVLISIVPVSGIQCSQQHEPEQCICCSSVMHSNKQSKEQQQVQEV